MGKGAGLFGQIKRKIKDWIHGGLNWFDRNKGVIDKAVDVADTVIPGSKGAYEQGQRIINAFR